MAYKYNINPSDKTMEKLRAAQEGTITDLIDMLGKHQIALMIRPTGFGKTYLMIELAKREQYEKVLYLYPIDVIKQSIYESYHKCDDKGNPIDPSREDGIKFTDSEEEHAKYPELPYIEFCTYSKMLEDYDNVYRFRGSKEWSKLNKSERDKLSLDWNKLDNTKQEALKKKWIKQRFEHIELLILDEAHTAGAEGFLRYWDNIHQLTYKGAKSNRLHVLGATATPMRTASDVDIINEVFYYEYGGEKKEAQITSFTIEDCWRFGILKRPYYVKGILDKGIEKEKILSKLSNEEKSLKSISKSLSDAESDIDGLMSSVKNTDTALKDAMYKISEQTIQNRDYMRFLVFYQKSDDMIESHEVINKAVFNAFSELGYSNINAYYITSDIEKIKENSIPISKVSIISERDKEIRDNPESGIGAIDIIHSIDMLNMGYHVGKVTGVIIKRATGSEIRYYQQIGRCVSVTASNQPLIIDLANADAELMNRAVDTEREEAVDKIKSFISGCEQDSYQNNAVNQIYKYISMCLDTEPIDNGMLDFWYFNRFAPIYFIWAISISLGKKETLPSLMKRLNDICKVKRETLVLDTEYCNGNTRINKKILDMIKKQDDIATKISKKQ